MASRLCLLLLVLSTGCAQRASAECREMRFPGVPMDAMPYVNGMDTTYWQVFAIRDSGMLDADGRRWEMIGHIDRIFRRTGPALALLNLSLALDTSYGPEASAVVLHLGGDNDTVLTYSRDANLAAWPREDRIVEKTGKTLSVYTFCGDVNDDIELILSGVRHITVVFNNGHSVTSHRPHPLKLAAGLAPSLPITPEPPQEWSPRPRRVGRGLLE